MLWGYKDNWSKNEMELPFRENLRLEADVQPLLQAITRQLLEKTLQAGKDSMCASDLSVSKLVLALKLSRITSCVLKWKINLISNLKSHQESLIHVTIFINLTSCLSFKQFIAFSGTWLIIL